MKIGNEEQLKEVTERYWIVSQKIGKIKRTSLNQLKIERDMLFKAIFEYTIEKASHNRGYEK